MRVGKTEKVYHFRMGRQEGIPLCCIIRWCLDAKHMACNNGVRFNRGGVFVPCGVFHRPHRTWEVHSGQVREGAPSRSRA